MNEKRRRVVIACLGGALALTRVLTGAPVYPFVAYHRHALPIR